MKRVWMRVCVSVLLSAFIFGAFSEVAGAAFEGSKGKQDLHEKLSKVLWSKGKDVPKDLVKEGLGDPADVLAWFDDRSEYTRGDAIKFVLPLFRESLHIVGALLITEDGDLIRKISRYVLWKGQGDSVNLRILRAAVNIRDLQGRYEFLRDGYRHFDLGQESALGELFKRNEFFAPRAGFIETDPVIGIGSNAVVALVENPETGEKLAWKKPLVVSQELVDKFKTEAELFRDLEALNIPVPHTELAEDGYSIYKAFVPGDMLSDILRGGKFLTEFTDPRNRKLRGLFSLLIEQRVYVEDLNVGNLKLDEQGEWLVIDSKGYKRRETGRKTFEDYVSDLTDRWQRHDFATRETIRAFFKQVLIDLDPTWSREVSYFFPDPRKIEKYESSSERRARRRNAQSIGGYGRLFLPDIIEEEGKPASRPEANSSRERKNKALPPAPASSSDKPLMDESPLGLWKRIVGKDCERGLLGDLD